MPKLERVPIVRCKAAPRRPRACTFAGSGANSQAVSAVDVCRVSGRCDSVGSDHRSDAARHVDSTGEAMSYPSGGPGYPGSQQQQPSGGYTPTAQLPKADAGPSKLPSYLLMAVAVLGLAAYVLSFGPLVDDGGSAAAAAGWMVTFAII